jgi:putative hydrolase of the HAD superfamily
MTTHLVFDFFGTLVSYSASRTDQGYERTFELLRHAGSKLGYGEFLSLWSEVSAGFDESAERSNREFSMLELAAAFLARAVIPANRALTREFVETYISEWNIDPLDKGPIASEDRLASILEIEKKLVGL